jgi:putative transposase
LKKKKTTEQDPYMPQSIAKVAIHVIFSTKNRIPFLKSTELRDELYRYMATVLKSNVDSPAIIIGGVEDHVHALCMLSRKFAIMKVLQDMKAETSKWIKKQSVELADFTWQAGYGAFSVSESNIPQVRQYIQDQEEHHAKINYQDEFRLLCQRHGVELDERYAWD